MKNLPIIFAIFCFCLIFEKGAWAITPYISLKMDELKNLTNYEIDFLKKSAFEAVVASRSFEIILVEKQLNTAPGEVYFNISLASQITNDGKYNLEFNLLEVPSGEVISKVTANKIEREKVQLTSRKMLYTLIFEKYNPKESELSVKEEIVKAIEKAAKNNANAKNQNRSSKNSVRNKLEVKPREDEKPIEEPGKEKAPNDKQVDDEKKNEKSPPRAIMPNSSKTNNFESPNLDLRKEVEKEKKDSGFKFTLKSNYEFSLGYEKEESIANSVIDSEATLETNTNTTLLALNFQANSKIEEWDKYFSYGGTFTKIISDDVYGIPPRLSINLKYNQNIWARLLFVNFVLEYERFSFVSLAQRGSGLSAFSNNTLWTGADLVYEDEIYSKKTTLGISINKVLVGTSDLTLLDKSITIDGNKLKIWAKRNIWREFGLQLHYATISFSSLSSTKYETNHSVVGLNLTYN